MIPKLVSIVIITYNSSIFITETLASIAAQTYKDIELIVSDDCSTDNTLEIVKNWISFNSDRFVNVEICESSVNQGVIQNVNKGMFKCSGEWIKLIAGDDLLTPNCIQRFVEYVVVNHLLNPTVVYCKCTPFQANSSNQISLGQFFYKKHQSFFNLSSNKQFRKLLIRNYVQGPALFIKKETFFEQEGIKGNHNVEDWAFALQLTLSGKKLHFLQEALVMYRIHSNSLSNDIKEARIFSNIYKHLHEIDKTYAFKYAHGLVKLHKKYNFFLMSLFDKLHLNNKRYYLNVFLFKSFFYLNIYNIYERFFNDK